MAKKEYLGDGVYVDLEGSMLKLTTENGVSTTNTIYLEPEVYTALDAYVQRILTRAKADALKESQG